MGDHSVRLRLLAIRALTDKPSRDGCVLDVQVGDQIARIKAPPGMTWTNVAATCLCGVQSVTATEVVEAGRDLQRQMCAMVRKRRVRNAHTQSTWSADENAGS